MGDDKITQLPVKFKMQPDDAGPMLKILQYQGCNHRYKWEGGQMVRASYLIREGETEVECSICGTRLDPMFVLRILAREETEFSEARARYQDEMKRLKNRSRTKCDNCGQMTKISRKS